MAKSITLSSHYCVKDAVKQRSRAELQSIAQQIRRGESISYDEGEINDLVALGKLTDSVSSWRVLLALLRIMWPGLVVMLVALLIFLLKRR